jgi:acyl-coenzyme A thioesterase PaaI-like protein
MEREAMNSAAATPDPWSNRVWVPDLGGLAYTRFLEAFRDLQDAVAQSNPPDTVWTDLEADTRKMVDTLQPWAVGEHQQPSGTRLDLPGRGHPFLVPFVPLRSSDVAVRGHVTFRRFHLGGNGAAHGGALPLLFDEILGRLSNAGGRRIARTASLTVNYRKITPIGVELELDATVDRQEGRKRWVSGRLRNGDILVADAEGLFIELREGQP